MFPVHFWLMEQSIAQRQKEFMRDSQRQARVRQAFDGQVENLFPVRLLNKVEELFAFFKPVHQTKVVQSQPACCEG
jgi:hypothetical protein